MHPFQSIAYLALAIRLSLEVVMLDRKDIPSLGAGETPILGIAPAIRNAIANATGKRIYTLPLAADGSDEG